MNRSMSTVRLASAGALAALVAVSSGAAASTGEAAARGSIAPTFERVIGGKGHAGLYAWGMATAKDGSILVGDYWNYRVQRFSPSGANLGTVINNSGNGATQYYTPYGLGVDPRNGEIFMADTDRYTIDVYSAGGSYLRSWGAKGSGAGKFLYPSRVVVSSTGTVYVADTWDHNVVVSTSTGAEIKTLGGFGNANGKMRSPHGLALDANDNLYVVDPGNFRIQVFDKNGNFLRKWGSKGSGPGQFQGDLRGIAINKAKGWVYVVDGEGNKISKFDLNGKFISKWGSAGYGNGQFADGGREATVDAAGNLWVADMPNFRVQKFTANGAFMAAYPSPAQRPPLGGFNAPRGVGVAKDGTVAVSDTYNWRIQTFNASGGVIKEWGRRGRGANQFNYARMVASNPVNNDWIITDTDNGRIVSYSKDGAYKWSSGTSGAGKSLKPHLLGSEVMGSMSPYGVGGVHRHTPEIEQNLARAAGQPVTASFTPTLAPMARGILATSTAKLVDGVTPAQVRNAYLSAYAAEPCVVLLPEGVWPRTADVLGANVVHLQVTVDERLRRLVAISAIDNLTKGTAGAAIQCLNLSLGLPELTGLSLAGLAP